MTSFFLFTIIHFIKKNNIYIYNILIIPIIIFFYTIKKNNYFFNITYTDIEYTMIKTIAHWSILENNIFTFLLVNVLLLLIIKSIHIHWHFNKLILLIALFYYYIIISFKELSYSLTFFNTLLNHTMGAIHPPLIIISIFIIRYCIMNINKKNIKIYFIIISISIITGSIWSSTLFGWNGLWMWDYVENISFYYWIILLLIIHMNNNILYIILLFYIIDFYFFNSLKIKIIHSIHLFQINNEHWNINTYPIIASQMYFSLMLLIILFVYYIKKNILHSKKIYISYIIYIFLIFITCIIIYEQKYQSDYIIKKEILNSYFYIYYIFTVLVWLIYINKSIIIYYTIIFFFFKSKYIILLLLIISVLTYSKKYFLFFHNHLTYFIVLFIFSNFLVDSYEIKNIEINTLIYHIIEYNKILNKNIDQWYKSIIENIKINNINYVSYINNIYNIEKQWNIVFFYKKYIVFKNDTIETNILLYYNNILSYSALLKEINYIISTYLNFFFIILILYTKKIYNQMFKYTYLK